MVKKVGGRQDGQKGRREDKAVKKGRREDKTVKKEEGKTRR